MASDSSRADNGRAAQEGAQGGSISLAASVAIGVGAMIGAGIFSMLGVVAKVAGTSLPLVFVIGAIVASFSVYSYTKLAVRYPSAGGPVQFIVQGYGDGVVAGGLNIFQYIAYIISLALYAEGFAGYAVALWSGAPDWAYRAIACGLIGVFVLVNFAGAQLMGRSELVIVTVKVAILLLFAGVGLTFIQPWRLSPSGWKPPMDTLFAVTIVFIGYQGFGLITNAAADMKDVKRQLPKAMAIALGITAVTYVLVALAVIGTTPLATIIASTRDVLAEVAIGYMGVWGFYLLVFAALLSTSSAVNATLYGSANIAYQVAKDGELPSTLFVLRGSRKNLGGLLFTAAMVIVLILFFDLEPISMMASGAFLGVYTAVNFGHTRVLSETGARPWLIWAGVGITGVMFVLLLVYMVLHSAPAAWMAFIALLAGSFVFEVVYRKATGRSMRSLRQE